MRASGKLATEGRGRGKGVGCVARLYFGCAREFGLRNGECSVYLLLGGDWESESGGAREVDSRHVIVTVP